MVVVVVVVVAVAVVVIVAVVAVLFFGPRNCNANSKQKITCDKRHAVNHNHKSTGNDSNLNSNKYSDTSSDDNNDDFEQQNQ